jgi:aryl-alcohol dehydrogenase-like predicted oxidoreductase
MALASNQVSISLLDRRIERNGVLVTARRLGITLILERICANVFIVGFSSLAVMAVFGF